MTALEEALDVLKDVATGGPRQRAVALARGARLLGDLSSSEKRELAVRVAEKAAPHLVPVIEAETGMDLSPQQISAVLDMARQLDEEQVEELRSALLDDDQRSDLAASLATDLASGLGLEIPDDLSGLDLDVPEGEPDAHLPGPPPPVGTAEVLAEPAAELVEDELSEPHEPHEPHELDLDPLPSSELSASPEPEPVATAPVEGPDPEIAAVAAAVMAEAAPELSRQAEPAATIALDEEALGDGVGHEEDTGLGDDGPVDPRPLLTDLRGAATPRARRAVLGQASTGDLWRIGPEARRDVVATFPDGWQRRRAIHHLLELDVVSADEAVALARSVVDAASRRWVVGSLSAAGLLDADEVRQLVSPQAADRIGARRGG